MTKTTRRAKRYVKDRDVIKGKASWIEKVLWGKSGHKGSMEVHHLVNHWHQLKKDIEFVKKGEKFLEEFDEKVIHEYLEDAWMEPQTYFSQEKAREAISKFEEMLADDTLSDTSDFEDAGEDVGFSDITDRKDVESAIVILREALAETYGNSFVIPELESVRDTIKEYITKHKLAKL